MLLNNYNYPLKLATKPTIHKDKFNKDANTKQ